MAGENLRNLMTLEPWHVSQVFLMFILDIRQKAIEWWSLHWICPVSPSPVRRETHRAGSLSDFDFRVLNFRVFQEIPWRPHPGGCGRWWWELRWQNIGCVGQTGVFPWVWLVFYTGFHGKENGIVRWCCCTVNVTNMFSWLLALKYWMHMPHKLGVSTAILGPKWSTIICVHHHTEDVQVVGDDPYAILRLKGEGPNEDRIFSGSLSPC